MQKLIGYTIPSDISEFRYDGFIRVKKEAQGEFTEPVSFKESDIFLSSITNLTIELDDFHNNETIMLSHFTKEDKCDGCR